MNKLSILIILTLLIQIVLPSNAAADDPVPDITATPIFIDFGVVPIGTTSLPETVTVTNDGTANLTIYGFVIAGDNASEFSIASIDTPHDTLPPGASFSSTIVFSPTSPGLKTAYIRICSIDSY